MVSSAYGKDVTALVIQHTDLDEKIHNACRKHCEGNRRRGVLRSVHSDIINNNTYKVIATASLVNHHHTKGPFGIGGGVGWSHTIKIEAQGVLDSSSCNLTITRIRVINDKFGLGGLARGEEGKIHKIANCKKFI